jgi:putative restriction endonuclease
MILGHAQRGGTNTFHFKDLVDQLEKALRDFGPERAAVHPEYPFWHLQRDGFWTVDDSEQFELSPGRAEPTKKALLEGHAVAHVPPEMWKELRKDGHLLQRLVNSVLTTYWPDKSRHKDILNTLEIDFGTDT